MQPDRNTKIQEHITKHKNTIIDNKFTEELATRILLLQSSKKWDESSTKSSNLQKPHTRSKVNLIVLKNFNWHSYHHLKASGKYPKQIAEKFENVSDEVSMGW